MNPSPPGKAVLITGAAGGLGRALVESFLSREWHVIAASRQPAEWESNPRLTSAVMDVTDSDQVAEMCHQVAERHGTLDCLIHNAGITDDGLLWQITDERWDKVLNVNLKSAFICAQAAIPQMEKHRGGHIIFISSFAGRCGAAGQSNYAAAKAGLLALAQSLAREFGPRNICVNAVLPGVLPTKMTENLPPARMEQFARDNVLGRINSLTEVAAFIAFLATTRNISGQVFQLDSRIARWG